MSVLFACVAGFLLDLVFGDPVWLYHPVRLIGALIGTLETCCRRLCGESGRKLLLAGGALWLVVLAVSAGVPFLLLRAAGLVHPYLRFLLESFWCYQILAVKSLKVESMKVYAELKKGDLPSSRRAVSMIVGRDTEMLDETGVAKAAVETVAENTSDGAVAPMLFLLLGGAPLGFAYKAVNTMDSMLGYKDEKYLYIGRVAAKADDMFNYLPARISALLMTAAAFLTGMDGKQAWKIFRRDRYNHASPNSAQTEAVCAGALRIQLAGDAYYFGKRYPKKTIGDPLQEVTPEAIPKAVRLLYGTAVLAMLVFGGARFVFCYVCPGIL